MSTHGQPTLLSVLDRALGSKKRTARLISLIIATTCCLALIAVLPAALLALSGGHLVLSAGLGALPVVMLIVAAVKKYRKGLPAVDAKV